MVSFVEVFRELGAVGDGETAVLETGNWRLARRCFARRQHSMRQRIKSAWLAVGAVLKPLKAGLNELLI